MNALTLAPIQAPYRHLFSGSNQSQIEFSVLFPLDAVLLFVCFLEDMLDYI